MGLIKLQGRAVTAQPSPAGVSGVSSVWWDVTVDAWSDSDENGGWKQAMARHGGHADVLMLDDGTGRMPVWLRDADLLLQEHTWESGKDALPERGLALLAGTSFAWNGHTRLRVRERRMEADGPVVVVGTLDEARRLPAPGDETGIARWKRAMRTGTWRNSLVRALPAPLRTPVTVTIGYLDLLFSVGHGGERPSQPGAALPPALGPTDRVVWKGRGAHPLIVSDRREAEALTQLRKRSIWSIGIGAVLCCWCLYELLTMF
jgi:hypothetical protein